MARKHKPKRVLTVGRIVPIGSIRKRVHRELEMIAHRLAPVRALAWRLCGSRASLRRSHEAIRDTDWMGANGRAAALGVPARVWKAALDDVLADIKANRESAKQAVIRNLYRRELADHDLDTKLDLLRHDAWLEQPLLRRLMRRQWKRGKTSVGNHIVLDTQCYAVRTDVSGKAWLDVTGLTPLERLAIPLANNAAISGTIRLILHGTGRRRGKRGARGGRLDIHHAYRKHRRASRGPAACV